MWLLKVWVSFKEQIIVIEAFYKIYKIIYCSKQV